MQGIFVYVSFPSCAEYGSTFREAIQMVDGFVVKRYSNLNLKMSMFLKFSFLFLEGGDPE
jgi:hypothetical protein